LIFEPSGAVEDVMTALEWFIWVAFAGELITKTYLAPRRATYLWHHWFDVVIVALPFLRPLRVVRSARALRLLRLTRLVAAVSAAFHSARSILDAHGLKYVLLMGGLVILGAAGLVTILERGSGGTITDFDDALWWAATTVTTVGYGDRFPVTQEGRAVAVVLMLVGITLFSLLTANIAAFLVETKEGATLEDVIEQLHRIEARLGRDDKAGVTAKFLRSPKLAKQNGAITSSFEC
jgi:voltage-gated potassium channel